MSDLLRAQQRFSVDLSRFLLWIDSKGWKATVTDYGVLADRRLKVNGVAFHGVDCVHMNGSLHYLKLAADINLFTEISAEQPEGGLVTSSDHPAWKEAGAQWLSMGDDHAWGGDWDGDGITGEPGEHDANHVSIRWGGKA